MIIRSFQLSDYASVTQLLKDVLSESCYEETMEAFGRQLSWDSDLVLVAVNNQQVLGIIIGTIDNNQGYYYRIAVDKENQRRGIGKSLVQALKQRFEKHKVSRVLITVDEHNEVVLPLYESMGFHTGDFLRSFKNVSIMAG